MADGSGSMPYFPGISNRDSTEGGTTVILVVVGVIVAVYVFIHVQRFFNRRAGGQIRRRPAPEKIRAREQTKFVDTHKEVDNGLGGTKSLPTGLRLTVEFPQYDKSYTATIINVSDESFVATLPSAKGGTQAFSPSSGDAAKFFAVRDDRHLTFTSTVLQVFSGGLSACSFRHTPHIEISNRRTHTRVSGEAPVLFSAVPQSAILGTTIPLEDLERPVVCEIPGVMLDISTGGCALRTRSPVRFAMGDLVMMNACLPGSEDEFYLLAGVTGLRTLQGSDGGGSLLNLEFLAPAEEALGQIGKYVAEQLEDEVIE